MIDFLQAAAFIAVPFIFFVFPAWAFVDALKIDRARWSRIGRRRGVWLSLIVAGTVMSGLWYVLFIRPDLKRGAS